VKLWLKRVPFFHKPPFEPGEGSVHRRELDGGETRVEVPGWPASERET
jgi:hypothetical protein